MNYKQPYNKLYSIHLYYEEHNYIGINVTTDIPRDTVSVDGKEYHLIDNADCTFTINSPQNVLIKLLFNRIYGRINCDIDNPMIGSRNGIIFGIPIKYINDVIDIIKYIKSVLENQTPSYGSSIDIKKITSKFNKDKFINIDDKNFEMLFIIGDNDYIDVKTAFEIVYQ